MMMKGGSYVPGKPKKTRQGNSQNTLFSATSRNKKKKKYRWTREAMKTKISIHRLVRFVREFLSFFKGVNKRRYINS